MWILILCIVVNSLIVILFKEFSRYNIEIFPTIVVNYFVSVITAGLYLGSTPIPHNLFELVWFPYAIVLGILFIICFNVIGISVQKTGLVITSIFQKMSLLAPAIMGFLLFNESSSVWKIIGIALALLAIIMVSYSKKDVERKIPKSHLLLALGVFIGSALIEALLYWVDVKGFVTGNRIQFVSTPFLISGIIGVFVLTITRVKNKKPIKWSSLVAGIILGVPNFFSIYLILKSLSIGLEGSVVFPVNNIGILLLSALVGIIVYKEVINRYKVIGFILAVSAILLISYG